MAMGWLNLRGRTLRLFNSIARMGRRGATAVEFALVATPFLLSLAAIMDVGLNMVKASLQSSGVDVAARQVRIGKIKSLADFTAAVESYSYGFVSASDLSVRVVAYSSFGSVPSPLPDLYDVYGNRINQSFSPGTGNQVVVVQVSSRYTFVTPGVNQVVDATGAPLDVIGDVRVFRNEAF